MMHLGVFTYPGGHHIAGWRHPSVAPAEILSHDYYRRTAEAAAEYGRAAERAGSEAERAYLERRRREADPTTT